jgi:hypothetical protein
MLDISVPITLSVRLKPETLDELVAACQNAAEAFDRVKLAALALKEGATVRDPKAETEELLATIGASLREKGGHRFD